MTKSNLNSSTATETLLNAAEPPTFTYHNILVVSNRGGVGKTTRTEYLIEHLRNLGLTCRAWEVDRNMRLSSLFGDLVTNITVPDAHVAADDEIANTIAFAPLFTALSSPPDSGINIVDVGANLDERVTYALVDHAVDISIDEAGRRTAILVIIDKQPETVAAAILSVRLYTEALPDAEFFIVQPVDDLGLEALFNDAAHQKLAAAYLDTIEPLLKKGSLLVLPRLRDSVHDAYRLAKLSPMAFLEQKPERLGKLLRPEEQFNTHVFIGRRTIRQYHEHFHTVMRQFERKLGFRFGTEASSDGPVS
jgi:hypothetical protein